MSILIAVLVFGLIILVHELGHFLACRRHGIWVEEFAMGMGPKLFGIQRGETLYTIRMLPIGGFCRMYGDDADTVMPGSAEDASLKDKAFNNKTIPQRMSVMFAGSFMNFVLSFVLFTMIAGLNGTWVTTLHSVSENSPAQAAGLAAGDRIVSMNGSRIYLWDDIRFTMDHNYGRPLEVSFVRDRQRYDVIITPEMVGNRYLIGISPEPRVGMFTEPPEGFQRISVFEALTDGLMRIRFVVRSIVLTLVRLFTAQLGTDQLAGPIGIVSFIDTQYQQVVADAETVQASRGAVVFAVVLTMANFGAFISANLGVFNLLPLPALDGGRIVFLFLEAIRRKPIPPEREGMVHLAGFVLLMILAVFIAYQDILNLL